MKKLLVESCGVLYRPRLTQESETSASTKGKWSASVWKLDQKNLNGRTYSQELAKRIVAENKVTVAYDGHDVDWKTGEEYGIAKAVCSSPRIENGELKVDIEFVDEAYEELLNKLSDKGVAIGVSSVGWGEIDQNGNIKTDSYELIRYLDFVTLPAGEVYATKNRDADDNEADKSSESVGKDEADAVVKAKLVSKFVNYFSNK